MKAAGRLIGLDLGSRRIGVAVSDSWQRVATGVSYIERGNDRTVDHAEVARLVSDYDAVGVVVGLPLSMSGQQGPAAAAVLQEVDELRGRLGVRVDTIDERLSTVAASSALRDGGRAARRQRAVIDQTAAALLLQDWMGRAPREGDC
jgi:putative Holliday junction resolvase